MYFCTSQNQTHTISVDYVEMLSPYSSWGIVKGVVCQASGHVLFLDHLKFPSITDVCIFYGQAVVA